MPAPDAAFECATFAWSVFLGLWVVVSVVYYCIEVMPPRPAKPPLPLQPGRRDMNSREERIWQHCLNEALREIQCLSEGIAYQWQPCQVPTRKRGGLANPTALAYGCLTNVSGFYPAQPSGADVPTVRESEEHNMALKPYSNPKVSVPWPLLLPEVGSLSEGPIPPTPEGDGSPWRRTRELFQ